MNRILVIDDEPGISSLICEALTRFGYAVKTAANGRQGLRLLKDAAFDLVVTDMCLPDLNGACIVQHVRSSNCPLTPVIGISGTPWMLEGAGCDAILPKPFSLQTLADTVKRLTRISISTDPDPAAFHFSVNVQPVL
jgi:DNA-binding response OmpR family regulator